MKNYISEPTIPSYDRLADIQIPLSIVRQFIIFTEQTYLNRQDLVERYKRLRKYLIDYLLYCPPENDQILLNHLHKLDTAFMRKISASQYVETEEIKLNQLNSDIQTLAARITPNKETAVSICEDLVNRTMLALSHCQPYEIKYLVKLFSQIDQQMGIFIGTVNSQKAVGKDKEKYPKDYMSLEGKSEPYINLPVLETNLSIGQLIKEFTNLYMFYYPDANTPNTNDLFFGVFQEIRATYQLNKGQNGRYTKQAVYYIIRAIIDHLNESHLGKWTGYSNTRSGRLFPEIEDAILFWEEVRDNIDDLFPEES